MTRKLPIVGLTVLADRGMQVPRLLFLKVDNELQLETDLTFVRAQP